MAWGIDQIGESIELLRRTQVRIAEGRKMEKDMQDRIQTTVALVLETEDLVRRSNRAIPPLTEIGDLYQERCFRP